MSAIAATSTVAATEAAAIAACARPRKRRYTAGYCRSSSVERAAVSVGSREMQQRIVEDADGVFASACACCIRIAVRVRSSSNGSSVSSSSSNAFSFLAATAAARPPLVIAGGTAAAL